MDCIKITAMKFRGFHGCFDFEKQNGQDFFVDAVLYADLSRAGKSDSLADTINYAAVYDDIKTIMTGKPLNLIEAAAEKIAEKLLAAYPVEKAEITVHKPQAPIDGDFSDISVTITRARA